MGKLTQALAGGGAPPKSAKENLGPDLEMEIRGTGKTRRVTLSGAGLTDEAIARLKEALKA